ncbi:hypothetical protein BLA60_29130 [Actinophytocola xinjiangensis]|uniref:Amidase domain-containing protein n=1 Tax=Actinophytocola xinjiangensis TaxID=485602 RepID=A0A7Z1AV65_9PSEU|nr:amidase [Actinophytocola xinjiangensis]OLF06929.1 hypothetical protein BLA60_29130 [Actinophytocola xinjiangensis]
MSVLSPPAPTSFQTATALFTTGADTPREFLERALERLAETEPRLRAFAALDLPRARMAADAATARWRAGHPRSPVDGMPVGLKDVIDVAGLPTGAGSPALEGFRPWHDSAAAHALRLAGAAIVGKTTTTELALTYPPDTRNPHDPARTPGGSSSGSAAAVGAGILPAALGTQAIGSVLRPASFCGTYGFKPTFGALNRGGTRDFHSQSCLGVLAASLADVWATAGAIATRAGGDPGHRALRTGEFPAPAAPRAVALLETEGWPAVTTEAGAALDQFLSRTGVRVLTRHNHPALAALETLLAGALDRARQIINHESRWLVDALADRDPHGLSPTLLDRVDRIRSLTDDDYAALLDWRTSLRAAYEQVLRDADVAVTLSAPGPAPVGLSTTGDAALTVPASLLAVPALSLPVFTVDGLPLGLQLLGTPHRDPHLVAIASWAEEVTRPNA